MLHIMQGPAFLRLQLKKCFSGDLLQTMLPSGNAAPARAPSHAWHVPPCVFADAPFSHLYLFASTAWAETESRDFGSSSSALQLFYLIPEPSSQGAGMLQPRDFEWN